MNTTTHTHTLWNVFLMETGLGGNFLTVRPRHCNAHLCHPPPPLQPCVFSGFKSAQTMQKSISQLGFHTSFLGGVADWGGGGALGGKWAGQFFEDGGTVPYEG